MWRSILDSGVRCGYTPLKGLDMEDLITVLLMALLVMGSLLLGAAPPARILTPRQKEIEQEREEDMRGCALWFRDNGRPVPRELRRYL